MGGLLRFTGSGLQLPSTSTIQKLVGILKFIQFGGCGRTTVTITLHLLSRPHLLAITIHTAESDQEQGRQSLVKSSQVNSDYDTSRFFTLSGGMSVCLSGIILSFKWLCKQGLMNATLCRLRDGWNRRRRFIMFRCGEVLCKSI